MEGCLRPFSYLDSPFPGKTKDGTPGPAHLVFVSRETRELRGLARSLPASTAFLRGDPVA